MAQSMLGSESANCWSKDMREWTISLTLEEKFVAIACWCKRERNHNMNKLLISYIAGLVIGAGSVLVIVEHLLK